MKKLRTMQIIKHALQHYITRPDADPKDIEQEKQLLQRYEDDIRALKKKIYSKEEDDGTKAS